MTNRKDILKLSIKLADLSEQLSKLYHSRESSRKFQNTHLCSIKLEALEEPSTEPKARAWALCEAIRKVFNTDDGIVEPKVKLMVAGIEEPVSTLNWNTKEYSVSILIDSPEGKVHCCNGGITIDEQNRERYYNFESTTINDISIEEVFYGDEDALLIVNRFLTSQLLESAFAFGEDMDTTLKGISEERIQALLDLVSEK